MTEKETFLAESVCVHLLHGLLMQSSIFYLFVQFFPEAFMKKKLSIKVHVVFRVYLINMPVPWESIT